MATKPLARSTPAPQCTPPPAPSRPRRGQSRTSAINLPSIEHRRRNGQGSRLSPDSPNLHRRPRPSRRKRRTETALPPLSPMRASSPFRKDLQGGIVPLVSSPLSRSPAGVVSRWEPPWKHRSKHAIPMNNIGTHRVNASPSSLKQHHNRSA